MESGISEALETKGDRAKERRDMHRAIAFFRPPLQSTTAHRGASTSIGRFTFASQVARPLTLLHVSQAKKGVAPQARKCRPAAG